MWSPPQLLQRQLWGLGPYRDAKAAFLRAPDNSTLSQRGSTQLRQEPTKLSYAKGEREAGKEGRREGGKEGRKEGRREGGREAAAQMPEVEELLRYGGDRAAHTRASG